MQSQQFLSHLSRLRTRIRLAESSVRLDTLWLSTNGKNGSGAEATKSNKNPSILSDLPPLESRLSDKVAPSARSSAPPNENQSASAFFQQVDEEMKKKRQTDDLSEQSSSVERSRSPFSDLFSANVPEKTSNSSSDVLFDTFSVPETTTRSPTAFDARACQEYQTLLERLKSEGLGRKSNKRPIPGEVLTWLQSEEPVVSLDLPSFRRLLGDCVQLESLTVDQSTVCKSEFREQRVRFMETMAWDDKTVGVAEYALYALGNICAKDGHGDAVLILLEKLKEVGFVDKSLLARLLYAAATFATVRRRKRAISGSITGPSIMDALDSGFSSMSPDDEQDEAGTVDLAEEIAILHDLLYEPTEHSISIRVRLLVSEGKAHAAEKLLDKHTKDHLRLRAYTPIFRLYLDQGDVSSALKLYKRMRNIPSVHLDVDSYVLLIAGLAENGVFSASASAVDVAAELGYSSTSGPELLDELATEMGEAFFEIPSASAKRLYNAFARAFPQAGLKQSHTLTPSTSNGSLASDTELIVNRVTVDPLTGRCPLSGAHLRLINLEDNERKRIREHLLTSSRLEQQGFRSNVHGKANKTAPGLDVFLQWLDRREGAPFTAIIDGANVGYFMQNFEDGKFSFQQIKFVVDSLLDRGEKPLIILPSKYSRNTFGLTTIGANPRYQTLTPEDIKLRQMMQEAGMIYWVPPGYLDDFFWMIASLSNQTQARAGKDLYVPHDNNEGRMPGTRPVLISNDQMRDHRWEMMGKMLFRRWYSNFMVNYNFTAFVDGECSHHEIGFSSADFFSREIQGNPSGNNETVWHFPISDLEENEWFCLRLPFEGTEKSEQRQ